MEKFRPELQSEKKEIRKVIISGGTEGIGRSIAENCLDHNQEVAICARNSDKLKEMQEQNPDLKAFEVDLSDRRAAQKFVEASIEELKGLDLLILNAGIPGVPHENETPEEEMRRKEMVFRVNEVAQIALTHAAAEELKKNNGRVVFITSGLANMDNPPPGSEDYALSKKRVQDWLNDFAKRPSNEGLHFFSINPGPVDTRMHEEIATKAPLPLSALSKMAKERGLLRDPEIVGKIIGKMSATGRKFNPKAKKYDIQILDGEIVEIGEEVIEHEVSKWKK